ncbi:MULTISPECIES: hypothetical protein [unclassified Leucobacter]|uniref:hypothetical protein n=1 Tax=unclassified Leucobacter TaxID=2621730 RepID=UPI00069B5A4C|nr:hypothetical protein [Leucobacter sp. Ag1]
MPLKRYKVTERVGRSDVETIMKLTEEEAARLGVEEYVKDAPKRRTTARSGAKPSGAKGAKPAANKARKPAANKARKPAANKAAPAGDKPADPAPPATETQKPAGGVEDASDPDASE